MVKLIIEFETQLQLDAFMDWLDGQGEQDYWQYINDQDGNAVTFEYVPALNTIKTQNNEPS